MRSDLVVALQPLVGDLLNIGERVEQVRRQHFFAKRPVESLDEGVLVGLTRLDEPDLDAVVLAPLGEGVARQLAAVVASDRSRLAVDLDELLHEANDAARRNARANVDAQGTPIGFVEHIQGSEGSAAVEAVVHEVQRPHRIDRGSHVQGPPFSPDQPLLRAPLLAEEGNWAEAGALMSYATNEQESYRRVAVHVDKILKGTKPAHLPVEQPTKFEFVINLKTAKTLNLTIPQTVLFRADKVIK